MKVLRLLLLVGVIVAVLGGLLLAVALSPTVQTWYVQRALDRHPEWHATVELVDAGRSRVHLTNLQFSRAGALVTVPEVDLYLPVFTALREHRWAIRSLMAKGWSVEVSSRPAAARLPAAAAERSGVVTPPASAAPSGAAFEEVVRHWLAQPLLPAGASIEAVELEGDFQSEGGTGRATRVHVLVSGGPVRAGATTDVDADVSSALLVRAHPVTLAAHGKLAVDLNATAAPTRIRFTGELAADAAAEPTRLPITAEWAVAPDGHQSRRVEISRAGHALFTVAAQLADRRLSGTWSLALQPGDVAAFGPAGVWNGVTAGGNGTFDTPDDYATIHLSGHATLSAPWAVAGAAALEPTGDSRLAVAFDATAAAAGWQVAQFSAELAGSRPLARGRLLQPVTFHPATDSLTPDSDERDCAAVSLLGIAPNAGRLPAGFVLSGGSVHGELAIRSAAAGWTVHSTQPLIYAGAVLRRNGEVLLDHLDASLSLAGELKTEQGWTVHAEPIRITQQGHALLSADAEFSTRRDAYGRIPLHGTWSANPDDWPVTGHRRGLAAARSIRGEFSANLGAAMDVTGKATVLGHDPTHAATLSYSASIDDLNAANLQATLQVVTGSSPSALSLEGTWSAKPGVEQVDLELTSNQLWLSDLQGLVAALPAAHAAVEEVTQAGTRAPGPRATAPVWGSLVGRVRFDLGHIAGGRRDVSNARGTLELAPDALRLHGARAVLNPPATARRSRDPADEIQEASSAHVTAEGELGFDRSAAEPYRVQGEASLDDFDGARLFGPAHGDQPATVEGHFAGTVKVSGSGRTLGDLVVRHEEAYHLTSTAGAVRILKTNVAASLPDAPTPGSDALASVGSTVGKIFGRRGSSVLAENKVNPITDAVLNFSYETRDTVFDHFAVTALRHPGGAIAITDLAISGPREQLTGTGGIAPAAGLPLAQRPLKLELRLGFRGGAVRQLVTAKLATAPKDANEFTMLPGVIPFGGTLEHVDAHAWHDLLVNAAKAGQSKR